MSSLFKYHDTFGGTEMMGKLFEEKVYPLKRDIEKYNWCLVPGQNTIVPEKINIAWIHIDSLEKDMQILRDPSVADKFKAFIFVSNWQYTDYIEKFNLNPARCFVVKNAIEPLNFSERNPTNKVKMIFHPDPSRGLNILLKSLKMIDRDDFELHIFRDLEKTPEKWDERKIKHMVEYCKTDSRIVLRGQVSNEEMRKEIETAHIFPYTSTFRETSCISMIESISAGCEVLYSNYAVLPETTMGFGEGYGYISAPNQHAKRASEHLNKVIDKTKLGFNNKIQSDVVNSLYSWETRVPEWLEVLHKIDELDN